MRLNKFLREKIGLDWLGRETQDSAIWNTLFLLVLVSIFISFDLGVKVLGFPITTQKIGLGVSALFLCVHFLKGRTKPGKEYLPITVPLSILTLGAFLATWLNSQYPLGGLKGSLSLLLTLVATLIWFGLIENVSPRFLKLTVLVGIPLVIFVQLALSISSYLMTGALRGRMAGIIGNPNETGGIILMAFPLLLTVLLAEDWKIRLIGASSVLVGLLGIFLTYSRSTYLVVIFFFLVFLIGELYQKNYRYLKRLSLLILLLIVIGGVVIVSVPGKRTELAFDRLSSVLGSKGGINLKDNSFTYRIQAVQFGWNLFQEKPFLGQGPIDFSRMKIERPRHKKKYFHAFENTYIHLLATTGLVGTLAFFSIIGITLWALFNNLGGLDDPMVSRLNRNLIYGFFAFLVLMLTNDFVTATSTLWVWIWIALSLGKLEGSGA